MRPASKIHLCGRQADWRGLLDANDVWASRIPPAYFGVFWEDMWQIISKAFTPEAFETQDTLLRKLLSGHFQLWMVFAKRPIAAAITAIVQRENEKVVHIEYAGSILHTINLWKPPLEEILTEFAVINGASAIECAGRIGWRKFLPDQPVVSNTFRFNIERNGED